MNKFLWTGIALTCLCGSLSAQKVAAPLVSNIKAGELKKDVIEIIDDRYFGREAGTLNELKSAVWLTQKMVQAGMKPAGDDGTFFQFFELVRQEVMPSSSVRIGKKSYAVNSELLVSVVTPTRLNAPILYIGETNADALKDIDMKGKVVVIKASMEGIKRNMSLFERRYPDFVVGKYYRMLWQKGAAGLILLADDLVEDNWDTIMRETRRGKKGIEGIRDKIEVRMPVYWMHASEADLLKNTQDNFVADIQVQLYKYPSVNLIGRIDGTDPKLKDEYVLFSSHHDYVGVTTPMGQDSICDGADDNTSMTAAVLATARAFKAQPARRPALFVLHGSEEPGMLGAQWYATHPTVPLKNIIAVFNGDLIAGNAVDSATLLGSTGTHMTSQELVDAALEANREGPKFKLDTEWDKPGHPEYFFFRSDHIRYARLGVPVLFFTSNLTDYYHTPIDDIDHISIEKLHKMTEWIYRTGWKVANADKRPTFNSKADL